MNNLRRKINRYSGEIVLAVIIIFFIIVFIQLVNSWAKNSTISEETNVTQNSNTDYSSNSKSIVSGTTVSKAKQDIYGETIDNFLKACINGETEKAYGILSDDCKNEMFPTQGIFEKQYVGKFNKYNAYNFQSWSSIIDYIYLVKIFPNDLMSTGTLSSDNYIQEYITIDEEKNEVIKLNVNSFIAKVEKDKEKEQDNIKIKVNNVKKYMDYEIYDITINNNTKNKIALDSRKNTESLYITNNNGIDFESMLYENNESDFIIDSMSTKTINIKFSNTYQSNTEARKMTFSDVITDYDEYLKNSNYSERLNISIGL